jgi:hypothetical protein
MPAEHQAELQLDFAEEEGRMVSLLAQAGSREA